MKKLIFALAIGIALALLPGEAMAQEVPPPHPFPPEITVMRYHAHPYFGDTWLVRTPEGIALAIPNRYHMYFLSYYEGEYLAGIKNPVPAWLAAIETGQADPGPRLPNP